MDESFDESTNDSTISNAGDIKLKLLSGEYKICTKRGRSKVWNVFGTIENGEGAKVLGFLACRKCQNIYRHNPKTTSNLVKHKCYINEGLKDCETVAKIPVDTASKKKGVEVFTKWVLLNCRPFKITADKGLKEVAEFFASMGHKFGKNVDVATLIPNPTTLSRNVESLYIKHFEDMRRQMMEIANIGYGLTTDLWTDNYLKRSYLALTVHFVKDGNIFCKLLGMKAMDNERNTAENVLGKVVKLLADFGCTLNSKTVVVTDRGSNMVSAFRPYTHLFCVNHLLQNALKKSMDDVGEIQNFCKLSSKLVKYFKKSGQNSKFSVSLKSYSPTRWNTFYYVFHSIRSNWNEITQILQEKNELHRLGELNVSHLNCLIEVLEFFEEALKKLEGDKYPTLHLVVVHIHKLIRTCTIKDGDISIIKAFKTQILYYINNLVLQNLNIFHKIALFLFPPANKLLQFEAEEKEAIREATKAMMTEIFETNRTYSRVEVVSENQCDLFDQFVTHQHGSNSADAVSDELAMYESSIIHYYSEFDALKWWDTNKNQFPLLYKTSCRVLAIPASSASSERVFSAARSLLTEKRSSLGGNSDTVNQIMFLHNNIPI